VSEEREAREAERVGQHVDVPREDLEAQRRRLNALAAPLAPLVDVDHTGDIGERVEPGPEGGVVEPGPAVENDQRQPVAAEVFDEHPVAVGQPNDQLLASCQSSPTPMSTASGGSRL
jgi:hypothetical protein